MPDRIVIAGISGTGKSFVGRRLAAKTDLPLHHMDSIIWSPGWVETPEEAIHASLNGIVASDRWIVEGWIDHYSAPLLDRADTIVYLDYPGWAAAWGGWQRWMRFKGAKRPELPEDCMEAFDLNYLHRMLFRLERPHIEKVLAGVPSGKIRRVHSRKQAERLLREL